MKDFISVYNEVFDTNGEARACGREKCIKLIELAESIKENIDFGNKETGMMNIPNIKNLRESLN